MPLTLKQNTTQKDVDTWIRKNFPGLFVNEEVQRDPTRSKTLRKNYSADLYKRFRIVKGLIRKTIIENDAFRLTDKVLTLAHPVRDFEFTTDAGKMDAFMRWMQEAEDDEILEVIKRGPAGSVVENSGWQNTYIKSGYTKGVKHAGYNLKKQGVDVTEETAMEIYNIPKHADAVSMLYTRNFRELKGITEAMDQQISRTLSEGFAQTRSPRRIARMINDRVDKVGITRARVLANTEIVRAHAEGALNRYERYGVKGVTPKVEWSYAGDACPTCVSLAGIYSVQEARALIPVHPNCRCSWIPIPKTFVRGK